MKKIMIISAVLVIALLATSVLGGFTITDTSNGRSISAATIWQALQAWFGGGITGAAVGGILPGKYEIRGFVPAGGSAPITLADLTGGDIWNTVDSFDFSFGVDVVGGPGLPAITPGDSVKWSIFDGLTTIIECEGTYVGPAGLGGPVDPFSITCVNTGGSHTVTATNFVEETFGLYDISFAPTSFIVVDFVGGCTESDCGPKEDCDVDTGICYILLPEAELQHGLVSTNANTGTSINLGGKLDTDFSVPIEKVEVDVFSDTESIDINIKMDDLVQVADGLFMGKNVPVEVVVPGQPPTIVQADVRVILVDDGQFDVKIESANSAILDGVSDILPGNNPGTVVAIGAGGDSTLVGADIPNSVSNSKVNINVVQKK